MADFEETLNTILSDQNAMGQIMDLARSLSGSQSEPPEGSFEEHADAQPTNGEGEALREKLDPELLQAGAKLLRQTRSGSRSAALMEALRPYLREEKREKLDRALKIAQTTRLIRTAAAAMGQKGGEGDV